MAVLFADPGAEHYFSLSAANAVTAGAWDELTQTTFSNTAAAGRYVASDGKNYALTCTAGPSTSTAKYLNANYSHLIAGYACYSASQSSGSGQRLIGFTDGTAGGTTTQCDVRFADASAHLEITRNGTQIGSTSTQALTAGWHYVELDVTFATSATGTADLWVDGVRWIHATSVQTANTNAQASRVYFGEPVPNVTNFMRDYYILDATTGANTTPLGDVTVSVLYPTTAGVNSQWAVLSSASPLTISSVNTAGVYQISSPTLVASALVGYNFSVTGMGIGGNNVTNVKCTANTTTSITLAVTTSSETHTGTATIENAVQDSINHLGTWPDGDAVYMSDATANDTSDFHHEALTLTGTLYSVIHESYVRKDDAGSRAFRQVCLSNGTTETNGSDISATNSYLYYRDVLDTDPHTSAAWVLSDFNNATFGVKEIT